MKRAILAVMLLALLAVPAFALGVNPYVGIYLYTTSTGVGGFNYKATPAAGSNTSVYVCFDHFGPLGDGVGGGMYAAQWQFLEVPGPNYMSTTNQFTAVGGLTIGTPGQSPGCSMTVGPTPVAPDANGIIVLARVRYETPEEGAREGGYIDIIDYSAGDGSVVADQYNELNEWCIHSVVYNGLSGHFGWDVAPTSDGDCTGTPVTGSSWGTIKALYR